MPRARTIKPGFHKNEELGTLHTLVRMEKRKGGHSVLRDDVTTEAEVRSSALAARQSIPEFLRSLQGQTWLPEHTERIEHHIWELEKTWLAMMTMALAQPEPK